MRMIDADKLKREHPVVTFIVDDAPTIEAIPIEWLKENLIGTEFYFGKGVDNTLAGETVWQMIVDRWQEDNGDEWWREEQNNEDD